MEIKYKDMLKALSSIETERNISDDVIKSALCDAFAKGYKKDSGLDDIRVFAKINEKKKTIDLYQEYEVVEDVQDDELEISLEDARKIDPTAELGSFVSHGIEITSFSRAFATQARNVMKQKIREAEKDAIYNEFIDQVDEMVVGKIESIEDKFALVGIDKYIAMMPISQQIPNERLYEGQDIHVVIADVKKEGRGNQLIVSRTSETMVKRLLEIEVPEVYSGEVEIKAIVREPGVKTKVGVISHFSDIDPVLTCIGKKGDRIKNVSNKLNGEAIDIFLWSEDVMEMIQNALSVRNENFSIENIIPTEDDRGLYVIVSNDDQLSKAIGKKGINARLVQKLASEKRISKIDIKTRENLEESGVDYEALFERAEAKRAAYRQEAERKAAERKEAADRAEEAERLARVEALQAKRAEQGEVELEEDGFIPEEMQDEVTEKLMTSIAMETEEPAETETEAVEEQPEETAEVVETVETVEPETQEEAAEEEEVKTPAKRKHADLEEMAEKNTYVSRFEKLTDTTKPKFDTKKKRFKKKSDSEENFNVDNKELEKQIKEKLGNVETKPLYSEEELEEIERQRIADEERELGYGDEYDEEYDDEYEDYYEDENN